MALIFFRSGKAARLDNYPLRIENINVPQAILFDLDGTIITWETPPGEVWKDLCRRYAPGTIGADRLLEAVDNVRDWYWSDPERHRAGRLDLPAARREIARMAFSRLGLDAPSLAEKIADAYTEEREQTSVLVPGAVATLELLRARSVRLALLTNGGSDMQRAKINKFGLAPLFDYIIIEGEFGCGKPDERIFLHALEKLHVRARDAWMVGDDLERDISPCGALGIYSVWVDGRGDGSPGDVTPDRIIRNISELKDCV